MEKGRVGVADEKREEEELGRPRGRGRIGGGCCLGKLGFRVRVRGWVCHLGEEGEARDFGVSN